MRKSKTYQKKINGNICQETHMDCLGIPEITINYSQPSLQQSYSSLRQDISVKEKAIVQRKTVTVFRKEP